jgi:hypothetical protein
MPIFDDRLTKLIEKKNSFKIIVEAERYFFTTTDVSMHEPSLKFCVVVEDVSKILNVYLQICKNFRVGPTKKFSLSSRKVVFLRLLSVNLLEIFYFTKIKKIK